MNHAPYRPEPTVKKRESVWLRVGLVVAMLTPYMIVRLISPWAFACNNPHPQVLGALVYFGGLLFAAVETFSREGEYSTEPSKFQRAPYPALLAFAWYPIYWVGLLLYGAGLVLRAFWRWLHHGTASSS